MKQPTTYLALDLELNQPSGKIIQVGVAVASVGAADADILTRQWLLSPDEPIAPFITELTGISDEDIAQKAVPWEQMAQELIALVEENQCFVNPVTWGGGDHESLVRSIRERGIDFKHFGRRWIDVKTIHGFLMASAGKNVSGGLRSAMGKYHLPFKGDAHRADVDAFNTLRLYFKLLGRQASLEQVPLLVKSC